MLSIKSISKSFDDTPAVQDLSLDVQSGKTTVLIGPSGCGKSTILRMINGLIPADKGIIEFEGDVVRPEKLGQMRHKMGYVIQEGGLFPHLTAFQNVTLMANYLAWDSDRIEHRLSSLTDLTQFPRDGLKRYPAQLSGGQRQRISLMRALMLDPVLLLMDEPLGALDPMIRVDLQNELKSIFQELKKTVLLVTHDLYEASFLGDTIILMKDGKIIQKGKMNDLVNSPIDPFVTRFINAQRHRHIVEGRES